MRITEKTHAALNVLLKLAREERAALTEDLADVATAKRSAESALVMLAQSCGPQGERDLARKRRLARALAALDEAEREARDKLEAAAGLASRLEALTFSPRRDLRRDPKIRSLQPGWPEGRQGRPKLFPKAGGKFTLC